MDVGVLGYGCASAAQPSELPATMQTATHEVFFTMFPTRCATAWPLPSSRRKAITNDNEDTCATKGGIHVHCEVSGGVFGRAF